MIAEQWEIHVPAALSGSLPTGKARIIGEMYARACYSILLLSPAGPALVRLPVRAAGVLPLSGETALRLAVVLLKNLNRLIPEAVHRQVLLVSALMGLLDIVLDAAASAGQPAADESAVLRVASLLTRDPPACQRPAEQTLTTLTRAIRLHESAWQAEYWEEVVQPAVRNYCLAEALAVAHAPDPAGMAHRGAGIAAALSGMWYALGPRLLSASCQRERRWMQSTGLFMQMIDDWVDQDEDRGVRSTPVVAGDWTLQTVDTLYRETLRDLAAMLTANGIANPALQSLFVEMYNDYLRTTPQAMRTGVAA